MTRKKEQLVYYFVPLFLDIIALTSAFLLAYFLRFSFSPTALGYGFKMPFEEYSEFLFLLVPLWVVVFASLGLYTIDFKGRFWPEFVRILFGTLVSVVLSLSIIFMAKRTDFSRLLLIYLWAVSFILVFTERFLWRLVRIYLLSLGFGQRRVLIIGNSKEAQRLQEVFNHFPHLGYKVMEIVSQDIDLRKLRLKIEKLKINDIVQAKEEMDTELAEFLEELARQRGINLHFIPDLYQISIAKVEVDSYGGVPLLSVKKTPLEGWGRIIKRIFDMLVSAVLLLVLSPLFLLVALAIKLDSKGPVFFLQTRMGRDGEFTMYKFRTMVANAEALKKKLFKLNQRRGPCFKIKNDPRITRLGKWLRRFYIDELPQLFNVLKGEMSLVGPRPHLPEEVAKYKNHHKEILTIKPGMTGLAQISGAADLDFEEEVRLDTYYVHNWSFCLDIIIILKTIWVAVVGKGAA
ncbi:sugar transferase [bacterium]|nr:sugar transferase [bacterium]